jgi:hypothetical protein
VHCQLPAGKKTPSNTFEKGGLVKTIYGATNALSVTIYFAKGRRLTNWSLIASLSQ